MISIVVPAHNEAGNIGALVDEIASVLLGTDHEIVVVDDGSTDGTLAELAARERPTLRIVRHKGPSGQSAALRTGVVAARSPLVCTLDGDGQNPPQHIPDLIAPFSAPDGERLGLVAGQRVGRRDTFSRRLASRLANAIRSAALRDGSRDTGCGLKAFRRDAYLALPAFDHMHRYLPALFAGDGWQVRQVDVTHRARLAGRSHYSNLQRGLVGVVDILGVMWLIRRRRRIAAVELAENRPEVL